MNVLTDYVHYIQKQEWNADEKIVFDETCTLFNKISNFRTYRNHFSKYNRTNYHQQSYEYGSEKKYYNSNSKFKYDTTRNNETSWRKKQENAVTFINSENKMHGKQISQKNETTKYQKEGHEDNLDNSLVKKFNKHLTICNSSAIDTEPNKLKNQHGFCNNLHEPNSKNDPHLKSTAYGSDTNKLNWKNKYQDRQQVNHCKQGNKINVQEQDKKSSFTNNSNVHSSSNAKVKNEIINFSKNKDIVSKDEHKYVTSKLDWRFQPVRDLSDQSKQH